MRPSIEHHPRRMLAGLSFFGDPIRSSAAWTEENEIGRLWCRLMDYLSQPDSPYQLPLVSYEIHLQSSITVLTGEYEVFAGFEVTDAARVPVALSVKTLPETDYAVFRMRGDQMLSGLNAIDDWLATSGYETAHPFGMHRYDKRFLGVDRLTESELDCLVPVRPAGSREHS